MKLTLLYATLLIGTANAFVERSSAPTRNTALAGGFLDGESPRVSLHALLFSRRDTKCLPFTSHSKSIYLCFHN